MLITVANCMSIDGVEWVQDFDWNDRRNFDSLKESPQFILQLGS